MAFTEEEYLLTCLMEECAGIQQAVSKCLRFGMKNYHPDDPGMTSNEELLAIELTGMVAVAQLLGGKHAPKIREIGANDETIVRKQTDVLHYFNNVPKI